MFFGTLREILVKKKELKIPSKNKISSVNLLIDGFHFNQVEQLVDQLVKNGIRREKIKIVVLAKREYTINTDHVNFLCPNDFGWFGRIKKAEINEFIQEKSDLLISYYKEKQKKLEYITANSQADFKVGFIVNEKLLNHITIDISLDNYKSFIQELVKYLKAFNKL